MRLLADLFRSVSIPDIIEEIQIRGARWWVECHMIMKILGLPSLGHVEENRVLLEDISLYCVNFPAFWLCVKLRKYELSHLDMRAKSDLIISTTSSKKYTGIILIGISYRLI